jgi:hypothetical protein
MYPSVVSVEPLENYLLSITFDNGEVGILDIEEFLDFGVFQRLRNRRAFENVRVSFDTIEWEAGVDLDPEFVYRKSRIQSASGEPLHQQ